VSTSPPDPAATPLAADPSSSTRTSTRTSARTSAWLTPLAVLTGVVALGDVVFMALIPELIPPLAIGVVLTLLGIALLRSRPRGGIVVLGLTSLLLCLASLAFLSSHLAHPGSAIDFLHAVLSIVGRALAVGAAVGAWRGVTGSGARRLSAAALGVAGVAIAISAVATLATSGEAARPGDIPVVITGSQFPDTVVVEQGQTLHLDNQDLFRHTFTVSGTALDVDLPATTAARATVELPFGSYDVICDIPGHEHMTALLEVR
jgi:plastocyanin